MTTTSDTTDDTKPTRPRRRSLFDLLDKLRPTPEPPRRRPAREIALGPERRPPAPTARDRAAEERMRRPFG